VNYAKLLEMNSFFTWHTFLEVGKTQDLPSKIWQTLGDALRGHEGCLDDTLLDPVVMSTPCQNTTDTEAIQRIKG
jgi:hypothetical protein